jgi:hypothetical protein
LPQTYLVGAEPERRRIPGWLAAILAFAAVAAVAYGIVSFLGGSRSPAPAKTAKKTVSGNPYARYLELAGFRINELKGKKLQVQFLAVNHSGADLANISGTITLKVKGSPEAVPACTFKFEISAIPAYGAKEVLVTEFSQRRSMLDMPDWQFLEPSVEFDSPPED